MDMKDLIFSLKVGLLLLLSDALIRGILPDLLKADRDFLIATTIYITLVMLFYAGWFYVTLVFVFIKIVSVFSTTLSTCLIFGTIYLPALFSTVYFLLGRPSDLMGDNNPAVTWIFYSITGLFLGYLMFRYQRTQDNRNTF